MGNNELLFCYAIIADTHFRPEQGDESSPWEVNKYANARARWVINKIDASHPDFVIHLGDIVHPLPHLSTYHLASNIALKSFNKIKAPVHYLPGNHDVGDKRNPMMPAYGVDEYSLNLYRELFGPIYHSFDYEGIHLTLINSELLNSGLPQESMQSRWLEDDLETNRGKRIHMFSHYPPYLLDQREPSNYDNIDEPARTWLLDLINKYKIEVFFCGHVHHFFYHRRGVTDFYSVLATSFVRQDYSEMFRIEPAPEYGRNDVGKLGWCSVEVYEDNIIPRIFRSNGLLLRKDETLSSINSVIQACHRKDNLNALVGVHLRHPWAEEIELPYNGPLDEFIRKRVRNDYTLLGLWECGIRYLRVPMSDLVNKQIRNRMEMLATMGHCFTIFTFGTPSQTERNLIQLYSYFIEAFEVILPWDEVEKGLYNLQVFHKSIPVPLFLAKIASSANQVQNSSKFTHYVSYGFRIENSEDFEAFFGSVESKKFSDGFVFEIGQEESPCKTLMKIDRYVKDRGIKAIANVRLASENPAEYLSDDIYVANRVAETLLAASSTDNIRVFLDTFMDLDRGYFPRIGLYDRRYNRRPGSFIFANLQGVLNDLGLGFSLIESREDSNGTIHIFEKGRITMNLILPIPGMMYEQKLVFPSKTPANRKGRVKSVDLLSGIVSHIKWVKKDENLILVDPISCRAPSLSILET